MTIIGASAPTTVGSRVTRIAGAAASLVASLWQAHLGRRAANQLLDLDDRMLRDMGVTRGDVRAAMALPVRTDPSRHLFAVAEERRAAMRDQAREMRDAATIDVL